MPNQELAKLLAEEENNAGIQEISEYLYDKNKSIASDCIKVLYEIGYLKPELIAPYAAVFIDLLHSKQNRMVWGGMIGISTIAEIKADYLLQHLELLKEKIDNGTVITSVSGIIALIGMAKTSEANKRKLLPILFYYLENTRPVDFARRLEYMLQIIATLDEVQVIENIVKTKANELSEAQKKKLKTVLNKFNKNAEYKLTLAI